MADINAPSLARPAGIASSSPGARVEGAPPDPRLITLVELFFFAYRDFTGEADAVLSELDFGRAHHRVLHFVSRNPGLRVADLLVILKITKQSLARVLKQLIDKGYIVQSAGQHDRRERRLAPTDKGTALARRLMALQAARVAQALQFAGPAADEPTRQFLYAMIGAAERDQVAALIGDPEITA